MSSGLPAFAKKHSFVKTNAFTNNNTFKADEPVRRQTHVSGSFYEHRKRGDLILSASDREKILSFIESIVTAIKIHQLRRQLKRAQLYEPKPPPCPMPDPPTPPLGDDAKVTAVKWLRVGSFGLKRGTKPPKPPISPPPDPPTPPYDA